MIHLTWDDKTAQKQVRCIHNKAKKFQVNHMLTEDKIYDVINETEEFIFILDNSGRVGGYYKEYFQKA